MHNVDRRRPLDGTFILSPKGSTESLFAEGPVLIAQDDPGALRDEEILSSVTFASYTGTPTVAAEREFAKDPASKAQTIGSVKVLWAAWPDGLASILAFNAERDRPRAEQLIRAYHGARGAAVMQRMAGLKTQGGAAC